MLTDLRRDVLLANLRLPGAGLVTLTWGNVSGLDRDSGLMVIKPSGVPYAELGVDDLVVVDPDGRVVEGHLNPSSDTATHLVLYRRFPELGGIVHTHSTWATAFAQAGREIPVLGTTHADLSPLAVPVSRTLTESEVRDAYERSTGEALAERVSRAGTAAMPAVLAAGHGPFCWAADPRAAVDVAESLEQVARMAVPTLALRPDAPPLPDHVRDEHYTRKHGPHATYGQAGPAVPALT